VTCAPRRSACRGDGLGAQPADPGLGEQARPLLHRDRADDLRRAGQELADARRRLVRLAHLELVPLAEPAPHRLP